MAMSKVYLRKIEDEERRTMHDSWSVYLVAGHQSDEQPR